MAELGVVIFTALDYGLKDEEERQLSPALENVIDLMTSAGETQPVPGWTPVRSAGFLWIKIELNFGNTED